MNGAEVQRALRRSLRARAKPENAAAMAAYMKSTMPFLGCSADAMRAACKETFADLHFAHAKQWREIVLFLWRNAKWREERYAAIELCALRAAKPFRDDLDALPMYEEMITTGAWWDLVDSLAQHRVGDLLRAHPEEMKRVLLRWAKGRDMWLARTAILAQNRFRAQTDLALLEECIAPSIGSKEFFLRKAIGWALRCHAYVDPAWVRRYVRAHRELSGLSVREALKNIGASS